MAKKDRVRHQNGVNVDLPTTLHQKFIDDLTQVISLTNFSSEGAFPHGVCGFKLSWLRENLLSKFSDATTTSPEDRRASAIGKWRSMETRNAKTNTRLLIDSTDFGPFTSEKVLRVARRIVCQIIGSHPDALCVDGMFTNGASTRVKRGPVAIAQKFVGDINVTAEARPIFQEFVLDRSPQWSAYFDQGVATLKEVRGSVMFTVPKNSEIDRVACKEPEANMYMQRGVGNYIRDALRSKRGINLQDQTANQRLAKQGSRYGNLATLDLSSASDLISTQLVYSLLPLDWFLLLDAIRVKRTDIDGEEHELRMFSSMGNGFTFELESLIFYALISAVTYCLGVRGRISVFGDDLIVPSAAAGMVRKVFAWFGFKVNAKKSYWTGPFRESCGKHYFNGCDVTPFFIRERISSMPVLINILNQYRLWCVHDDAALHLYNDGFYRFWKRWSGYVTPQVYGGRDCGDRSSLVTHHSPRKQLTTAMRKKSADQLGAYLHWLRGREEVSEAYLTSYGSYTGSYQIKRNRTWERVLPANLCWYEEYFLVN